MSALLADDLYVPVPTRTQPARWRHVERGPRSRPQLAVLPGGRPAGVPAPEVRRQAPVAGPLPVSRTNEWRLTDRGIAVVVVFFLALVATAAVVLVTGFLAVSDAPLHEAPARAAVLARG